MGNLERTVIDDAIIDRATNVIIGRRDKLGPYANQLGGEAQWHVLTTQPQHERTAAAHLTARGFGIYLPELVVKEIKRGRLQTTRKPMFPGYLFLFCWGIRANWRRIHSCPGVSGILLSGENPAVVSDSLISVIQAEESLHDSLLQSYEPKRKRRWRKTRNPQPKPQSDTVHVRMTTYSALQSINSLDDAGRNGALRKALGLVS